MEMGDSDDQGAIICGQCKSKVSAQVICDLCGGPFHPACLKRHSGRCEERIKENEVMISTDQEVRVLKLEISLLKRIINEKEEKNSILLENNTLLKEKIKYIETFITKASGDIYKGKAATQHITTPMEKSTATQVSRAISKKETQSTSLEKITSQAQNSALYSNEELNKNTKEMQQQQQQIMTSVMYLDDQTKEMDEDAKEKDDHVWQTVNKRRDLRKKKKSNTILGEATETGSSIRAVPRLGYLHVYRLQPDTTTADLDGYMQSKSITDAKSRKLSSKHPDEYSSFMVSFPIGQLDAIQKPEFWPNGVRINRFFHQPPWKKSTR